MKFRSVFLAFILVLSLLAAPVPANAASIPFKIRVAVDNGGGFIQKGVATPTDPFPLPVRVNVGETVRFVVGITAPTSTNINSYQTTVTADDPNEIDYISGSGTQLLGINFALLADPETQLNDATPGAGDINSAAGSVPGTSIDFYRIDYLVQSVNADVDIDFAVEGTFFTEGNVDGPAGGITRITLIDDSFLLPEPASIFLLGSGLAALAGLKRRNSRRP